MKEPMQTTDDVVVIEALRTPRGAAKETGALHQVTPMELLAGVLRELRTRTDVDTHQVADGVFGCVTQTADQGGNIGWQIDRQVRAWNDSSARLIWVSVSDV